MDKEELIASTLNRINQIRERSKKQWYSLENLQEAIDELKMSIANYLELRPNDREALSVYLEHIRKLEDEIYS